MISLPTFICPCFTAGIGNQPIRFTLPPSCVIPAASSSRATALVLKLINKTVRIKKMWCYHPFLQNKFARAYVQMVGMMRKRNARENVSAWSGKRERSKIVGMTRKCKARLSRTLDQTVHCYPLVIHYEEDITRLFLKLMLLTLPSQTPLEQALQCMVPSCFDENQSKHYLKTVENSSTALHIVVGGRFREVLVSQKGIQI